MFLVSLFFAYLIHMIENQEACPGSLPEPSVLSLLGNKSYGIYLWHYPLIVLALI